MAQRHWWLVAYDIRDPKRYREIYERIRGYGQRVQYSVFRCRLTARQLEELRYEVAKLKEPEDRLMFVPVCRSCRERIIEEGPDTVFDLPDDGFVVL